MVNCQKLEFKCIIKTYVSTWTYIPRRQRVKCGSSNDLLAPRRHGIACRGPTWIDWAEIFWFDNEKALWVYAPIILNVERWNSNYSNLHWLRVSFSSRSISYPYFMLYILWSHVYSYSEIYQVYKLVVQQSIHKYSCIVSNLRPCQGNICTWKTVMYCMG